MTSQRPHVTLNNGVEMPILGFGVFQIHDLEQCERCVYDAITTGYRLIDTAAFYGNEEAVGKAIKKADVPREELFITTKVGPRASDAGEERTKRAFERSLERLQLDYIDLYLIHIPVGDVHGAWRAMQDLYREGRAKAIGVSNFAPDRVMDLIMNSEVAPAVNQIETHPFHQQVEVQAFLKENGIQHESWAPLAEGQHDIFNNETLVGIAEKHDKTVAQITLRWLTQRGIVAIPKSVHKERIEENFNIFDIDLTAEDMESIASLDRRQSTFDLRDPEIVKMFSALST